jgi:hypothetical protein
MQQHRPSRDHTERVSPGRFLLSMSNANTTRAAQSRPCRHGLDRLPRLCFVESQYSSMSFAFLQGVPEVLNKIQQDGMFNFVDRFRCVTN